MQEQAQEQAARWLSELAHPARLAVLNALVEEPGDLAALAARLAVPSKGLRGHLLRLQAEGLVERDGGAWQASRLGLLVHHQTRALGTLADLRGFLTTHGFEDFPSPLHARLGDLASARVSRGRAPNQAEALRILREANERIRILAIEPMHAALPIVAAATREGIDVEAVLLGAVARSPVFQAAAGKHRFGVGHLHIRVLPRIRIGAVVTEREATLGLHSGEEAEVFRENLVGTERAFLAFSEDVFRYAWEQAAPFPLPQLAPRSASASARAEPRQVR